MSALELREVRHDFGEQPVLREVDLTVGSGEVHAVRRPVEQVDHGQRQRLQAARRQGHPAAVVERHDDGFVVVDGSHPRWIEPAPIIAEGNVQQRCEGHPPGVDLDAQFEIDALPAVGVDLAAVTAQLEDEGVAAFAKAFDDLLATLQTKADQLGGG